MPIDFNVWKVKKEWQNFEEPITTTKNSIAHPVRSIIRNKEDFKRVLICLEGVKKIMSRIS